MARRKRGPRNGSTPVALRRTRGIRIAQGHDPRRGVGQILDRVQIWRCGPSPRCRLRWVRLASLDSLPDVFSYWAGARTQFVADSGSLHPIDEMWNREGLDNVVAKSVADSATMYNGKRYLVPFNNHYAGMFYNKKVFADAGITDVPATWDEFLALCETLSGKGVTPIALGSKFRWPGQFWFDYLLLRTAGPDYRENLMSGVAAYDDAAEVGLSMFSRFMDDPSKVDDILAQVAKDAAQAF